MKKIAVMVAGVCLTATVVLAADGEPFKAGGFKSDMVNAYPACTTPTETTGSTPPLPACPASDPPMCAFGAKGKATVQAKAKTDIAMQAIVSGLTNCDGAVLHIYADATSATNDCTVSSRCNTVQLSSFGPIGSCTVAKGKCKIKTTLGTDFPGLLTTGNNTAIAIDKVAIGTGTVSVAVAGVLVP
jgi:hypothetical protein